MFTIRKATENDLPEMLIIYENARQFMKENGNESQWGLPSPGKKPWPSEESLHAKLAKGIQYICDYVPDENKNQKPQIAATFGYEITHEPVYDTIFDGQWPDDSETYGVIHAFASSNIAKGSATYSLNWALEDCKQLRIDTHPNNIPMQNLLKKNDFTYAGKVIFEDVQNDDTLRVAFYKILK